MVISSGSESRLDEGVSMFSRPNGARLARAGLLALLLSGASTVVMAQTAGAAPDPRDAEIQQLETLVQQSAQQVQALSAQVQNLSVEVQDLKNQQASQVQTL